jgi:hypothetical protein
VALRPHQALFDRDGQFGRIEDVGEQRHDTFLSWSGECREGRSR